MKKLLTIIFIFILISIFAYYLNEDKLNKISTSENDMAFLYEMDNGNYEPGSVDKWNEGYALNVEKSSCEDQEELLSWDTNTNEVLLTTDKPTKCTLYFSQKEYVLLSGYPIDEKEATLTNMVKNGDFENGSNNWRELLNCSISTEQASHGEHSLKFDSGVGSGENNFTAMSRQDLDLSAPTLGHSYYGRLMFLSNENFYVNDSRFEWVGQNSINKIGTLIFAVKNIKTTQWALLSDIVEL